MILDAGDAAAVHQHSVVCSDLAAVGGQELEPLPAVLEVDDGDDAEPRTLVAYGFPLLRSGAVRHGDVTSEPAVDVFHHTAENLPMRGRVPEAVETYVVMDHFVDDSVFHFARGEVVPLAYTQSVIVVLTLAEQPSAALERELSDVRCRVSQYNRDTRQRTVEDEPVELIEFGLDVFYLQMEKLHMSLPLPQARSLHHLYIESKMFHPN